MENQKTIARNIIRRYEESKWRVAKRIAVISRKDTYTEEEMEKWKTLELYQLNLRNESQTASDIIVELGALSDVEAAEAVAMAAKEAEGEHHESET